MNQEISDVQAGFRKLRGIRVQTANICWITEKVKGLKKKKNYSSFTDYAKAFDGVDDNKLENS